ncbi:protein HIT1 [Diplogelasinospora grovesii]|uniref:Protein HIT1 n=1 Tax=Diplogelasinospora grovesii TaxID=303347 RepID=A0AAN6NL90_9PEZI|nr:protein HIT1 [Diplogelasinospora grovesii]
MDPSQAQEEGSALSAVQKNTNAEPEPQPHETTTSAAPASGDGITSDDAPPDNTAPQTRAPKLCGVCNKEQGKYKCPRCTMPYCSVACNKIHKENHPPDDQTPPAEPPKPTQLAPEQPRQQTEDDPYKVLLDHESEFQRLFSRYPGLEGRLARIYQFTLPPTDNPSSSSDLGSSKGGGLPNKRQVLATYGSGNGHQKKQQPWTREVGLRKGVEALREARTDPQDVGEGVREFCQLVLFLLKKQAAEGKAPDATTMVTQEVKSEEAKTIEKLLREEGGER